MEKIKHIITQVRSYAAKTPEQRERERMENFLSGARDIYDLEYRQKQWDRYQDKKIMGAYN